MAMKKPGPLLRWFARAPYVAYRARFGWLFGSRFLMITTTGRKTGTARRTMLEVAALDGRGAASAVPTLWVIASRGRNTDWYRNAVAGGPVQVDWKSYHAAVRACPLDARERVDLLADYRRRHPKAAALLSRGVLGEELTDDPEAVRRLATELRALRLEPVSREA
jgi:deazaflavin-dependent oxidoreductase (nitroreductase family)